MDTSGRVSWLPVGQQKGQAGDQRREEREPDNVFFLVGLVLGSNRDPLIPLLEVKAPVRPLAHAATQPQSQKHYSLPLPFQVQRW